jgi:hypothetical protein
MTRRISRKRSSLRRNSSRRYEYRVTPGSGGRATNVLGWSLADAKKFAAHAVRAGQMEAHIERARRYPGGHRGEWSHVMTAYKKLAKNSGFGSGKLRCDMYHDCTTAVTHMDHKGYFYCTLHAARRKSGGIPTRKLRPTEIKKMEQGVVVGY